MSIYYNVKNG